MKKINFYNLKWSLERLLLYLLGGLAGLGFTLLLLRLDLKADKG